MKSTCKASGNITIQVMGFDIRVIEFDDAGWSVCTTVYMSYNWSDLSDIWYVREHMHDKPSSEVSKHLVAALAKLDERGIKSKTFDSKENPSWGWGLDMSKEDRLGVFRSHLEYLLTVATQYPDAYFLDEETDEFTVNGRTYIVWEKN